MRTCTKLYLSSAHALATLRLVRKEQSYILAPAGSLPSKEETRLAPATLDSLLTLEPFSTCLTTPMHLKFPSNTSRMRTPDVKASGNLSRLPADAFLEILTSRGNPLITSGSQIVHVYIEAPAMALISASARLGKKILVGELSKRAAIIQLVSLVMELAGSYTRDPSDPLGGEVTYGVEPISNNASMRTFLQDTSGLHGIKMARQAAAFSNDASGSPMETLWYLLFCLPNYYGGLHMEQPLQNQPIAWPKGVEEISCHHRLRPDFLWPQYKTACEYESRLHQNTEAFYEDRARAHDYELCKVACLPITELDTRNNVAIKAFLYQLVRTIRPNANTAFRRKMARLLQDPGVDKNREILIAQLHPRRLVNE